MSALARPKRQQKLWRSCEFQHAYLKGLRIHGPHLNLFCIPNKLDHLRMGLSVSKNRFKLSTQRHLVQRRLKEALRLNKSQFLPGFDIVIGVQRFDVTKVTFAELQKELMVLAEKAGLLKKKVNGPSNEDY